MAPQRDWLDYVDVFGGLIMTILTFMLGFILARYIEKRKTRQEQQEMRSYFLGYWQDQVKSARGMIESFALFCNELDKYNEFGGVELFHHIQPFFMYDSMDKQKLFDSFRAVRKDKFLFNAMKLIDLARASEKICLRHYEAFNVINNENRERWNAASQEYQAVHFLVKSEIVRCLAEQSDPPVEIAKVNSFYEIKFSSTRQWFDEVIVPLDQYMIDVYHANPDNPVASRLLPALGDYRRAMNENIINNKMTAELIRKQITFLNSELGMVS